MLVKEILLASEISRSGLDAPTYASFAGIMTGFAFAGLTVYLERQERKSKEEKEKIRAFQVVTALFYAMSSLAICAFLYSSLAGESDPGRALVAALIYGPVLGMAVLSLFYSMTLMMFEHNVTEKATRYAYQVVVYFGPALVIRFLASHSHSAYQDQCKFSEKSVSQSCETTTLLWIGFISIVVILILSLVITRVATAGTGILHKFRDFIAHRPASPSLFTFFITATVAIFSLFISTLNSGTIPDLVAHFTLIIGSFLMASFAFLCGCVLNRRIQKIRERKQLS